MVCIFRDTRAKNNQFIIPQVRLLKYLRHHDISNRHIPRAGSTRPMCTSTRKKCTHRLQFGSAFTDRVSPSRCPSFEDSANGQTQLRKRRPANRTEHKTLYTTWITYTSCWAPRLCLARTAILFPHGKSEKCDASPKKNLCGR